jgi:hypothetical protein
VDLEEDLQVDLNVKNQILVEVLFLYLLLDQPLNVYVLEIPPTLTKPQPKWQHNEDS